MKRGRVRPKFLLLTAGDQAALRKALEAQAPVRPRLRRGNTARPTSKIRIKIGVPARTISSAHAVFLLPFGSLRSAKPLETARRIGFRVLRTRNATLESVEILRSKGRRAQYHVHHGGYVTRTVAAVKACVARAEALEWGEDPELRLLRALEFQVAALWLHGRDGDILCPLGPGVRALRSMHAVVADRFFDALRANALTSDTGVDPAPPPRKGPASRVRFARGRDTPPPPPLRTRA